VIQKLLVELTAKRMAKSLLVLVVATVACAIGEASRGPLFTVTTGVGVKVGAPGVGVAPGELGLELLQETKTDVNPIKIAKAAAP
jgi:hypothetical protein